MWSASPSRIYTLPPQQTSCPDQLTNLAGCCCSATQSFLTLCYPMVAACQTSLFFTISQSLLKLIPIELMMPSNHIILCHPLLLLLSIFPSIRVFFFFSSESVPSLDDKSIGASASVLPMNIRGWFPLGLTGLITLQSKGLSSLLQHHSSKASILQRSAFFIVQLSHPYMTTRKTIALTRQTFVDKVMSLLFNMLSRLVIDFLPRSKRLLISWLQSPSAVILEPKKIKSLTVSTVFPSVCHEVMGPDAMTLVFWMLSFKPTFSFSSFTFIQRLFSSSSLSAIRVVSSAYLRLLIFSSVFLIPACTSSSPACHMMYSVHKLNKQGDNIQPWSTPFPIWNESVASCLVLTVSSWPAYRFLKRQVRWPGIPISLRIFHSLLLSTDSEALA